MNYNVLLAGGFKNLNSTSYINSTLQIFLHFRPFVKQICLEKPTQGDENYSLIICLQNLIKKLKTTDRFVSTDPIVSAMNVDPNKCETINNFFLFFRYLVPFNIIKFELGQCELSIQEELLSMINKSKDFSIKDLSENFMYIHLKPSNIKLFNVNENLSIYGFGFTLYAVVQVIISTTMHNHYFVTIRDKNGWVRFNDTAVTEIDRAEFLSSLNNLITPIEILVYIKDINDSEIMRRHASLQSEFTAINNHFDDNQKTNPNIIETVNSDSIEHNVESGQYEDITRMNFDIEERILTPHIMSPREIGYVNKHQNIQNKENYDFNDTSSDDVHEIFQNNNGRLRLIDSDPHQKRLKRFTTKSKLLDADGDIQVKFFDASQMMFIDEINGFTFPKFITKEKIKILQDEFFNIYGIETRFNHIERKHGFSNQFITGKLYDTFQIDHSNDHDNVVIFELKNMPSFDMDKYNTCQTSLISFYFSRENDIIPKFSGRFAIKQTYKDIYEYVDNYMKEIRNDDSSFNIYLQHKQRYYKVHSSKKIKDIQELINSIDLQFLVIINDLVEENDLFSIKIPIYLLGDDMENRAVYNYLGNIDDNCESIINRFKQHYRSLANPIIIRFDENQYKFIKVGLNENIIELSKYSNLRLQTE